MATDKQGLKLDPCQPATSGGTPDHPVLVAPPPVIFIGSVVAGLGLEYLQPTDILPNPTGLWLGIGIAMLGIGVLYLCLHQFHQWKTPINPHRATTTIIRTGPFRYSRNPVYLSLSGLQIALALMTHSLWVLAALALALVVIRFGVIRPEEAYLQGKFGTDYSEYKASVRRWL